MAPAATPASGHRVTSSRDQADDQCSPELPGHGSVERRSQLDLRHRGLAASEASDRQHAEGGRCDCEKETQHGHHDHPPTLGRQPAAIRSS